MDHKTACLALILIASSGVVADAQAPLPVQAILEADRYTVLTLPPGDVIATCDFMLRRPMSMSEQQQADVRLRRAWVHLSQGMHVEANLDLKWLTERFPTRSDVRYAAGACCLAEGRPALAAKLWEALLQDDEAFIETYEALAGDVYLNTGRYGDAISMATRGLEKDPHNPMLLYVRGAAYYATHNIDACLRDVDMALSLACLDARLRPAVTHSLRGCALLLKGQTEAALHSLRMAAAMDSRNPRYRAQLCQGYLASGQPGLAMAMADTVEKLPLPQSDPMVFSACAYAYLKGHEYEKALKCAKRWIEVDASDPTAQLAAGLAAVGIGDYSSARLSLQNVLDVDPRSRGALAGMAFALAFDPDVQKRDLVSALEHAEALSALDPARGFGLLGFVHAVRGDSSAAGESFRRCLATGLSPERMAACEKALQHTGNAKDAPDPGPISHDALMFLLNTPPKTVFTR